MWSQRIKNKLNLILFIALPIIFVFGGIIGMIILSKYHANALALHEIQQGVFFFLSIILLYHSFI
jgi:hypothetical protein